MKRDPHRVWLILMVATDAAAAVGTPLWDYFFKSSDLALWSGAAFIAANTFLGIWAIERRPESRRSSDALRDAIASSFVLTYLVIVSWSAFFNTTTDRTTELQPLTSTLITNFTALTGVVVGSYFGVGAVEKLVNARQSSDTSAAPSPDDNPPSPDS